MKWRDTVTMAIMHGPLPPDVTLDVPHWWQLGMPLLRPTDHVVSVPRKRKHLMSVESETVVEADLAPMSSPVKRAYMRAPDEAKLWFVDFHAYHARVHGKTHACSIRRAKQLAPQLLGPVAPDTFRRWHDRGAPNAHGTGRPSVELPPFALSSLANLTHAIAPRLSLSVPSWQHVYRCVLRELDIEFEPQQNADANVSTQPAANGSSRRLAPAVDRVRPTLPQSATSCSCASSTCGIASESRRTACETWTRLLCAWFLQVCVGGPRRANQPMSSPMRLRHRHTCCRHERRHVDTDCL